MSPKTFTYEPHSARVRLGPGEFDRRSAEVR